MCFLFLFSAPLFPLSDIVTVTALWLSQSARSECKFLNTSFTTFPWWWHKRLAKAFMQNCACVCERLCVGEWVSNARARHDSYVWDGHFRSRSNRWMALRRWLPVWRQATPTCHSQMSASGRWLRTWSSVNICFSISKPGVRQKRQRWQHLEQLNYSFWS